MSDYRRAYIPGGTYFFTVVTYERRPLFGNAQCCHLLDEVIHEVRGIHPFTIEAWVYLPDHLHCVWTLPEGDADYSKRWGRIKAGFSKRMRGSGQWSGTPTPSQGRRLEASIWQRRFWEHAIRDEEDWRRHVDYIHFNPVKHGLVACAKDWPHSSFHRFVAEGLYPLDWGGNEVDASTETFGE